MYKNKWAAKFSRSIHFFLFKIQNNKEVKNITQTKHKNKK